jgi:hypothetical protein
LSKCLLGQAGIAGMVLNEQDIDARTLIVIPYSPWHQFHQQGSCGRFSSNNINRRVLKDH